MRRRWSTTDKLKLFLDHERACHICGHEIDGASERWEVEHIIPLAQGGDDDLSNCAPAHVACHKEKTRVNAADTARAKRRQAKHLGARATSSRPMPGSKASGLKKLFSGKVVRR